MQFRAFFCSCSTVRLLNTRSKKKYTADNSNSVLSADRLECLSQPSNCCFRALTAALQSVCHKLAHAEDDDHFSSSREHAEGLLHEYGERLDVWSIVM